MGSGVEHIMYLICNGIKLGTNKVNAKLKNNKELPEMAKAKGLYLRTYLISKFSVQCATAVAVKEV